MHGNETADERGRAAGEPVVAGPAPGAGAGSGLTAGPVIAGFGSQSALARAIGARQSTVQHWAKTGQIPSWRRPEIARAAEERGIALGGVSELPGGPGGPGGPGELKTET
ncbi:MAG TPA: YdaS family helix-turn-helix protein, partial [Chloroflexota bacterium]|nr:YdaS family helix-turn-helix protein [Chloroflexota bacterium]